jgi:hypothetical protein
MSVLSFFVRVRPCRARAAVALLFGLGLVLSAPPVSAARACVSAGGVVVDLRIVSGALSGRSEEQLVVRVHDDGCVAVQRPWYLRQAGQYEIRLDATEWASLRAELALDALRGVSADSLQQEAKAAEALAKREEGEPEIEFHALDADVFTLQWREGGVRRELVWADVLDAADQRPKSAGINALASTVRVLQPLLQRDGMRVDSGSVR